MTQREHTRFPVGLPTQFVGEQGFVRLCELLGINRHERQQLVGPIRRANPLLRPPKASQAKDRHRFYITHLYSQPDARRDLWEKTLAVAEQPQDLPPSLEYCALVAYDPECFARVMSQEEMTDALALLPDLSRPMADPPDSWRPALGIWPTLRGEVVNWAECRSERRSCVVAVVFAVATVLDDVRLIRWVADQAPELADEFAFAFESPQRNSAPEDAEDSPAYGNDVVQRWNEVCRDAAALLSKLGADPPQPQLLPDLHRAVQALDELHDPLLAVQAANRPEKLVQHIADTITALADEYDASWLRNAVAQIHAQWKLRYLLSDGGAGDRLRAESRRVELELSQALTAWGGSRDEIARLQSELSILTEQQGGNLASLLSTESRRGELEKAIARHREDTKGSMLRVLDRAAPEDREFDPLKDYESEWAQSDTGRNGHSPQQVQSDSQQRHGSATTQEVPHGLDDSESSDDTTPAAPPGTILRRPEASADTTVDPSVDDPTGSDPGELEERVNRGGRSSTKTPEEQRPATPRDAAPLPSTDALNVLWNSIGHRPAIAYHIARLLSEQDCDSAALPPADLVAATILSDRVRSADGKTADALIKHLGQVDPDQLSRSDPHVQDSLHLLLFSATMRPALLVPATGAPSLLRRVNVSDSLTPVHDLAVAVAEHGERLERVRLDVSLFGQFDWSEQMESVRARIRDWLRKAKSQRILYGPAHRVWLNWLGEAGCLGKLAALLLDPDCGKRHDIKDILEQLSTRKSFDSLVEETDRRIRGRKRGSIEGRARPQLEQHAWPLVELAAEWLRLVDAAPDSRANFVDRNLKSLRRTSEHLGDGAAKAIDRVTRSGVSGPLSAALARARTTVDALRRLFEQHNSVGARAEDPDALLTNDLLYAAGVDIDLDGRPVAPPGGADILSLLADVGAHAQSLRTAYEARLARGDLYGARLAYQLMETIGGTQGTADALDRCRASLEREERGRRINLLEELMELQEELEQVFCFGQLSEGEAASLRADLVEVEGELEGEYEPDAIRSAEVRITEIRQSLSAHSDKGTAEARAKLEGLDVCGPDARLRVEQAIEQGDLLTANELMSRIGAGEDLEPDVRERRDPFREFMSVVEEIEGRLVVANGIELFIQAAEERKAVVGVRFDEMSESEAESAAQLIRTWGELAQSKVFVKKTVDALLVSLGFPVRKISSEQRGRDWAAATVETDLVRDRSRCPLPQFGSAARGRYRILLNWGKTARESIPQVMGGMQDVATIVLHFEPLGADRNWLRRWAVDEHRVFMVIDPALVVFLAPRGTGRLPALFHCALPFTDVDPFVTTSGLVPPELFFGRAHERKRITDPFGACFIYGGRQLGKTALLRTVEREFHQPDKEQVAKWIDLKAREIGRTRKAADIWPLLWRELRQLDVVRRPQLPQEPNPENAGHVRQLIDTIGKWVAERSNRRLLLLLDEADEFLEADAKNNFRESTRLKGLMDDTERRFKVVFAGLHNVLRTTERANHPLAHFGVPINVGPLLANGEWQQAQQLVREPLRSVGYGFATRDLSTLILAQTNYYPSLIQLYGAELVRRLRDSKKPVPYDIQAADITEVYRSKDLGSVIRERFFLTLNLDQRYSVIAYALAFELRENARQLRRGLDRRKIKECASGWWPEGFGEDDRGFDVLLQEMEGLGVLRSTEDGQCYTLRNPNILLLLGNGEEIARALEQPRELPRKFEPSVFHARRSDDDNDARHRCPLTYEQESILRARSGVAVICGCDAAEIDRVPDFLSQRIEKQSFQRLAASKDVVEFRQDVMKRQPFSVDLVNVLLVPEVAWDSDWIKVATSALKKKKTGHLLKVVFVTQPDRLWDVMIDLEGARVEPEWICIGPWDEVFVGQWLEDNTLPDDREHTKTLMGISGGWSMILDRIVRRSSRGLVWDKMIDRLRKELRNDSEWLARFGVTPTIATELSKLLHHQPFGPSDIESVAHLEGEDATVLKRRTIWCERLGLLTRDGDQYRFNPLVERLLDNGSG